MGTGYWLTGTGYWVLGTGYWVLASGYWVLANGYWVLGIGYWVLGSHRLSLSVAGSVTPAYTLILLPNCRRIMGRLCEIM